MPKKLIKDEGENLVRKNFARNLVHLLEERKVTQKELASHLLVAQPTVNRYCMGQSEPTLKQLVQICDYLNISIEQLFVDPDSPKEYPSVEETKLTENFKKLSDKNKEVLLYLSETLD